MRTNVLAIDPDPFSRKILQRILTAAGSTVKIVPDTEEALDALDVGHYDLMIINMPKLEPSTFDFVKLVRFTHLGMAHLPVILLSPPLTDCAQTRSEDAAIDTCLTKPVDPAELIDAMENLTQKIQPIHHLN
ncbi:MAG: response regulator [Hyphomicrobiales bacterium]|nr:response regulator [Hyphomicrobiales bacterium]